MNSPPEADTAQFVSRARDGDRAALAELIGRHVPQLLAYVRLRAGAAVLAKESLHDVVQSACREALADLDTFRYQGEAQFRGWLFTHALHKLQNKARDLHAQRRDVARERAIDADEGLSHAFATLCTPSRELMGREALAAFERAFTSLPDDQREAILQRRVLGLDYDEIAKQLGKSEGAVRNLVYRGVARLAELTRSDGPSPA